LDAFFFFTLEGDIFASYMSFVSRCNAGLVTNEGLAMLAGRLKLVASVGGLEYA
tara:strand:- start:1121 stop:1282 length:162 start_codon:yes stop_codon:yes gene_type:complete